MLYRVRVQNVPLQKRPPKNDQNVPRGRYDLMTITSPYDHNVPLGGHNVPFAKVGNRQHHNVFDFLYIYKVFFYFSLIQTYFKNTNVGTQQQAMKCIQKY